MATETDFNAPLNYIELQFLHFDPLNPRLPSDKRGKDDSFIFPWMLKEADLLELMTSIATTGYSSAEPLLVTKNMQGDGYIVVEGNRRLAALKLLQNPELAPLRKKSVAEIAGKSCITHDTKIPVLIYNTRDEILDYLGYRHITGTKAWGPRQKAEYLKQLVASHESKFDSRDDLLAFIASMIGSKAYYAKKLLATLSLVEIAEESAFWGSPFLEDRIDDNFSVLHTALSYENIRSYIGLDEDSDGNLQGLSHDNAKDILEWVCGKQKVIRESRDLKKLSSIVSNAVAVKKLKAGLSLDQAAEYTGIALEDFRHFIDVAYGKLKEADSISTKIDNFGSEDEITIDELRRLANKIYGYIKNARYDDVL